MRPFARAHTISFKGAENLARTLVDSIELWAHMLTSIVNGFVVLLFACARFYCHKISIKHTIFMTCAHSNAAQLHHYSLDSEWPQPQHQTKNIILEKYCELLIDWCIVNGVAIKHQHQTDAIKIEIPANGKILPMP